MFLTLTANFGIGLSFSKDPGSTFSEGPGKGMGLLYKVCPGKYRNLDIKSIKSKLSLECQKSEHPPKLLIAGPYKKKVLNTNVKPEIFVALIIEIISLEHD